MAKQRPDVIIMLGGGTDGTSRPVLYTKERLAAFLKVKKVFYGIPIIVSGGYSTWTSFVPQYREADVMAAYLQKHGITPNMLFIERKSRDTIGNAYFSKHIVKKHPNWKNILVITTRGHKERSAWIFKKVFGSTYRISFLEVATSLPSFRKNPGRIRYERELKMLMAKALFLGCKSGDEKALAIRLKKYHPAYSKSRTAKELGETIRKLKLKYLGYTELKVKR